MRIVVVSLELTTAPFSGNGVLAAAQSAALAAAHSVTVLSAAPDGRPCGKPPAGCRVVEVGVPAEGWGRLDAGGPWSEFAAGAAAAALDPPDVVLAIDWTGWLAARACPALAAAPVLFAAFRVHSRTDAHPEVARAEREAARDATAIVALCAADAAALAALAPARAAPPVAVLVPPLRAAIRDLPPPLPNASRTLLTCCVRLSPEKEADRFVALVEAAAARGAFAGLGVVPALVGAGPEPYASSLRARLLDAWPAAVVVPEFLAACDLARRVLDRTALNIHPPLKDAFGMTVVEAGARGAPTALHGASGSPDSCGKAAPWAARALRADARRGAAGAPGLPPATPPHSSIGAAALLRPEEGESLVVDFGASPAAAAAAVAALLADRSRLATVGAAAAARARAHDESAHGAELGRLLAACVGRAAV